MSDIVLSDEAIQALYSQLRKVLNGPDLPLEIKRVENLRVEELGGIAAPLDGYAGFEGRIVLSIDTLRTSEVDDDTVAFTLMHEILHKTYEPLSESAIMVLQRNWWNALYPDKPWVFEIKAD